MTQAQPAYALTAGTVVGGTYRVTRLLGRGGMGSVWEADHVRLPGKRVAIKVLHTDVASDSEALARFRREAEIATRLGHPNIVEVHDFNTLPDGEPYLVLEMLVGESLDARLRRAPVTASEAIHIAGQIAAALSAAHREGVIHRDLKPQNVFLVPRPEEAGGNLVKVLDFGISKIRGSQTVKTQDSTILGTPQYMAPEQATGNHAAVDARTDVFALGAIVYEMLAGCPAFTGHSIPEVVFKVVYEEPPPLADRVPNLASRVTDAVTRAMSKQQDQRFADVTSFVEAMAGVSLSTLRRQAVLPAGGPATASAEGARAVESAATMAADSQQVSGARAAGSLDRATRPAAEDALAATVDSGRGPVPSLSPPEATDAAVSVRTELTPRPASRRGWLVAVVGIVAVSAVALAFILRGGASQSQPADSTPAASSGANHPASPAAAGAPDPAAAAAGATAGTETAGDTTAPRAPTGAARTAAGARGTDAHARSGGLTGDSTAPAETPPTQASSTPGESPTNIAESLAPAQPRAPGSAASGAKAARAAPAHPDREGDQGGDEDLAPASLAKAPAEVRDDLVAAEKALRAGNFDRAGFYASRAHQHGAGPRSMALRAMASCGIQDLSNAKASARQVPRRRRKLHRVIRAFCAQHHVPLGR